MGTVVQVEEQPDQSPKAETWPVWLRSSKEDRVSRTRSAESEKALVPKVRK